MLANKVQEWLFDNGDGEKMVKASKRFLANCPEMYLPEKRPLCSGEMHQRLKASLV